MQAIAFTAPKSGESLLARHRSPPATAGTLTRDLLSLVLALPASAEVAATSEVYGCPTIFTIPPSLKGALNVGSALHNLAS